MSFSITPSNTKKPSFLKTTPKKQMRNSFLSRHINNSKSSISPNKLSIKERQSLHKLMTMNNNTHSLSLSCLVDLVENKNFLRIINKNHEIHKGFTEENCICFEHDSGLDCFCFDCGIGICSFCIIQPKHETHLTVKKKNYNILDSNVKEKFINELVKDYKINKKKLKGKKVTNKENNADSEMNNLKNGKDEEKENEKVMKNESNEIIREEYLKVERLINQSIDQLISSLNGIRKEKINQFKSIYDEYEREITKDYNTISNTIHTYNEFYSKYNSLLPDEIQSNDMIFLQMFDIYSRGVIAKSKSNEKLNYLSLYKESSMLSLNKCLSKLKESVDSLNFLDFPCFDKEKEGLLKEKSDSYQDYYNFNNYLTENLHFLEMFVKGYVEKGLGYLKRIQNKENEVEEESKDKENEKEKEKEKDENNEKEKEKKSKKTKLTRLNTFNTTGIKIEKLDKKKKNRKTIIEATENINKINSKAEILSNEEFISLINSHKRLYYSGKIVDKDYFLNYPHIYSDCYYLFKNNQQLEFLFKERKSKNYIQTVNANTGKGNINEGTSIASSFYTLLMNFNQRKSFIQRLNKTGKGKRAMSVDDERRNQVGSGLIEKWGDFENENEKRNSVKGNINNITINQVNEDEYMRAFNKDYQSIQNMNMKMKMNINKQEYIKTIQGTCFISINKDNYLNDVDENITYDLTDQLKSISKLNKNNQVYTVFPYGIRSLFIEDTLYIFGGKDEYTEYSCILSFNILTKQIEHIGNMLEPRSYFSLTYDGDSVVYIVGGEKNRTCEKFILFENKSISLPSLLFNRCNPCLFLYKKTYLYAFGGFNDSLLCKDKHGTVERLLVVKQGNSNPITDHSKNCKWEKVQLLNEGCVDLKYDNISIVQFTDELSFLVGGLINRKTERCVTVFDFSKNRINLITDPVMSVVFDKLLNDQTLNTILNEIVRK